MTVEQSCALLDRAEASLRETAEQLIEFPLDPARACRTLESARAALETARGAGLCKAAAELRETARRVRQEAARVQHLLEAAAALWFRCISGGVSAVSYTAAGEFQAERQPERFAFRG